MQEFSKNFGKSCRDAILPAIPGQIEMLPRFLSGSQAKTAFALRLNAERMIREDGLESTGFLTLTVGDYVCDIHGKQIPGPDDNNCCPCCADGKRMKFLQVMEADEASRRFNNLNKRVLPLLMERAIVVTERHKTKAIHFHLLGTLAGRPDIRTGLNFAAVEKRDYRSASAGLRATWEHLRDILPRYGFGRSELLPVKKTGEAVAAYVSKYIEKNVCNRLAEDKGKKLVRYIGWGKLQLKANEFEWDGDRARAWRGKARQLCALVGVELPDSLVFPAIHVMEACVSGGGKIRPKQLDGSHATEVLGPRWAFLMHHFIQRVDDKPLPQMDWDYSTRCVVRDELAKQAGARHVRNFEKERSYVVCGAVYTAAEYREGVADIRELESRPSPVVEKPTEKTASPFDIERLRLSLMKAPVLRHLFRSRRAVAAN